MRRWVEVGGLCIVVRVLRQLHLVVTMMMASVTAMMVVVVVVP